MSVEIPTPGQPDPAELAAPAAATTRRPSLWRHPDFMKLWSAQTISLLGDEMTGLAVPLIAILILHATAFEMGVLGTLLFLPFILLTLPAGAWVDRLRRRPILIAADLGRAAILLSITPGRLRPAHVSANLHLNLAPTCPIFPPSVQGGQRWGESRARVGSTWPLCAPVAKCRGGLPPSSPPPPA
ncbi:MAG: hypothetical protein M3R49_10570 [Chloroflexota bacterium]|nr:hypothetical protein [Chloroflexota bacterium]